MSKRFKTPFLSFIIFFLSCGVNHKVKEIHVEWEYKVTNKEESPKELKIDNFKKLSSSKVLNKILPKQKGYLWLKADIPNKFQSLETPMSIGLGKIVWADVTYLNSLKIGSTGNFPPRQWNAWSINRIYKLEKSLLKNENIVLIKVYIEGEGTINDTIIVGNTKDVQNYYFLNSIITSYINIPIAFLFFFISIYHFLIFSKRKKDKENLYYGMFGIVYSIYLTNFFSDFFSDIGISYLTYQKIIFSCLFLAAILLTKFLISFVGKENRPLVKYSLFVFAILPIFIEVFQPNYILLKKVHNIILVVLFPMMVYVVYVTVWGLKNGKKEAKIILYGLIPLLFFISYDALFLILDKTINYYLSGLGFTIFLSSIMFMIANKTVEIHNQTEELNATLEEKVIERTREVTSKMEEIKALKVQQDGDYFLTSLIEKPLATNYNKSLYVTTQFYISQKKQFEFRNKKVEVGGDICITGNLRFFSPENRYVVFFNGDAMGKSMQGAGGAIVMGTAMNYIISRSAKNDRLLFITPEKWLEETYYELNDIFKTFNGSMMISGVLGLIQESSGELFYFNAEHPWTVLFRNKEATFIENELSLRKLGCDSEFEFSSKRFQLIPGDVILIGSDGRDDLDIGKEIKEINEDETLFLEIVKYAKANLEKIIELLKAAGNITDDLSLMRIGYKEEDSINFKKDVNESFQEERLDTRVEREIEVLKNLIFQFPLDSQYLLYLANLLIEQKLYEEAIPYLKKYTSLNPNSADAWYKLSISYRHTKQFIKSIEAGNKALEIQPGKIVNLLNMADNYRQTGELAKAKKFVQEILNKKPDNQTALALLKIIENG